MTSYDDDDDSQYDIYAINSRSTYDPYYDDYYDAYTQQASTPASNAQDTTQSTPIREHPEPTPLPHLPISPQEFKAIVKQAVDDAFRQFRLTLLPHESKPPRQPIGYTPTPEPPAEPPRQPIPHTCTDVIEASTKHVVESSTKHVSSAVVRNIATTTPPTLKRLYTVPTSLTQAKSTSDPASTTRHAPHTRTARFVFDPGGKPYESNASIDDLEPSLHTSMDDTHRTNHGTIIATKLHPPYKTGLSISHKSTTPPRTMRKTSTTRPMKPTKACYYDQLKDPRARDLHSDYYGVLRLLCNLP